VKVALPVVRGLHGSRTEGTTRRFKVGDFKTEFNGLGVLRTDIRTVPGRRRGDRIGERMSPSGTFETYQPKLKMWAHRGTPEVNGRRSNDANDPQPTSHAESHRVSAMVRGPQRERRPTSCKFA
jgi:hypothetical protein